MEAQRNNLLTRTLTGAIFVAVVVGATIASPWSFIALLAAVCVGCIVELRKLTRPAEWAVLSLFYVVLPLVLLGAVTFMQAMGDPAPGFERIRWIEMARLPLFLLLIIWANDTFAYLVGIACGRHKMAPHLSPKKSWEGFAGGLAGAVGVSLGAMCMAESIDQWMAWAGFGLVVALGSVAGDLFESRLKRHAGVKDSGSILPGHGGFLDRFDSLLFAAPCAAIYLACIVLLTT